MKKIMFNECYGHTEAVLSGRKTQTRRIVNLSLENLETGEKFTPERIFSQDGVWKFELDGKVYLLPRENLPKYKVGEVVAVAQKYCDFYDDASDPRIFPGGAGWTNKMFVCADLMPHRIRITNVRVERLQDISDEDCKKEGLRVFKSGFACFDDKKYIAKSNIYSTPREAYTALINRISGKGVWESNPFCFVYNFELVK